MKTIFLTCLIYTLKNKEVKDNLYLNIFFIWLGKVIQSGGLTEKDQINITIDTRTHKYLETTKTPLFYMLDQKKVPCNLSFTLINPPANSLEGMMNKYLLINYIQDIFIYCDIDILIMNPFSSLVKNMENDKIYACIEGKLKDHYYSDGFSNHVAKEDLEESLEGRPGFSAGKFAITGKEQCHTLFKIINDYCDYSTNYATMEQPFFNMALYLTGEETISVNYTLFTEYVSFNGEGYKKETTVFLDNAGESAVASVHVSKTFYTLSLFLSGVL